MSIDITNERYTKYLMDKSGVAWWKMNDTSGMVFDSKGSYHGANYNLQYLGEEGIGFNGTSSYVQFNDPVIPVSAFSFYFEIETGQIASGSNWYFILGNSPNSSFHGFRVAINSVGVRIDYLRGGSNVTFEFTLANTLQDNKRHKVLLTWDGTTSIDGVKLFINNFKDIFDSRTASTNITTPTHNFFIGKNPASNGNYFQGKLRNIQIYNEVINPISDTHFIKPSDGKIYSFENNEWIDNNIANPIQQDFADKGMFELNTLVTPTSKAVYTMEYEKDLEDGRIVRKEINSSIFNNQINAISIREVE